MPNLLEMLPMMPEWWLVIGGLGALSLLGSLWAPLLWAWPLFGLAAGLALVQAIRCGARNSFADTGATSLGRWQRRAVTALLYLVQPLARLCGRLRHGLTLWRRQPADDYSFPRAWTANIWASGYQSVEARLQAIEVEQRVQGTVALHGSAFDRWDLQVTGGMFGAARLSMAVENHCSGRQLLRFRSWPRCSLLAGASMVCLWGLALAAAWKGPLVICALLGSVGLWLTLRTIRECAFGTAAFLRAVRKIEQAEKPAVKRKTDKQLAA